LPIFEEWRKSMQTSEKISNDVYQKRSFLVQLLAALATTNSAGSEIELRNAGWLDALEAALCIRDDNLRYRQQRPAMGANFLAKRSDFSLEDYCEGAKFIRNS
jgi:hypothetical protein